SLQPQEWRVRVINCFSGVREGEAIGFAHQTEWRQRAANAVSCGDFNAVPETAKAVDQRRRRELSTASS
ncbi:MAG: hypothetical protein ACK56I_21995, partial [bacterium]